MAVEDIRKQDCSGIFGFMKDVEMLLWNNLDAQQSTFKVYSEANQVKVPKYIRQSISRSYHQYDNVAMPLRL